MRINPPSRSGRAGSTLIMVLLGSVVVGMALAGYLTIVLNQNRSVMRSMQWNIAIPLAEAGVEEAIAQLNNLGTTNFSGWSSVSNTWQRQRSLGDGYYIVSIDTNTIASPVIVSTGHAPAPLISGSTTNYLTRTIRVTTKANGLFARGLVARGNLTWTGNIYTDSFDSLDPNHSNAGRYDFATRKDNGSVGSNNGLVLMGGGYVLGGASSGPSGYATNGTVGDVGWVTNSANAGNIQPGHYNNDMNLFFPDVTAPFTGGYFTPGSATVVTTNLILTTNNVSSWSVPSTTNQVIGVWTTNLTSYPSGAPYVVSNSYVTQKGNKYTTNVIYAATNWYEQVTSSITNTTSQYFDYVLDTGNYLLTSLSMSGQSKMLVRGDAVLYVTGPTSMAGQSQIIIAVGGSLKIYAGGNMDLKGNGVMNANNDALDFSIFGLPTCTSIDLGGNASFTGTIYAPQAAFKAGGGGSDQYDVSGAVIANTISMNGHFSFHYDEALGRNGPMQGFVLTSWNEL
jgi:Tfp pilus assembly protein PilX